MNESNLQATAVPTHIAGLDFILNGGVPAGRTTLLVGGPGCGKTVLATEFIAAGAAHGSPGLIVSFDAPTERILADMASFEFDLHGLVEDGLVALHHIGWQDARTPSTGTFTLEGLMIQLDGLLDALGGARRIALDGMESLLSHADDEKTLRGELRRLFDWMADRGVTSMVTAEQDSDRFTRFGVEEYLTDCVILLDYDVEERVATRRLRVLKRRGGGHSGDRHPFVITKQGIELMPLTSSKLTHSAPSERVPTGVAGLDELLGGAGYFRGSSILVSGTPGAGKSSVAAAFVSASCARGETALYLAYEESPRQIVRNMASIGHDLGPWVEQGHLHIHAQRPSEHGLETHLLDIERALRTHDPDVVVLDPFTSLTAIDFQGTARGMMVRLVDLFKQRNITALYTSLGAVAPDAPAGKRASLISSLMDTWLVLEARRRGGERLRFLWILKSRGTNHSRALHRLRVEPDGLAVGPAVDAPEAPEAP